MGAKSLSAPSLLAVRATAFDHPPLEGEGRTAAGSPGWGDGDAAFAEALSPPPGPLARADLPPPGGGDRWRGSCAISTPHDWISGPHSAGRRFFTSSSEGSTAAPSTYSN